MTSKADLARYRRLQEIGCMACRELGFNGIPGDIHHLVDKGNRKASGGNKATIVLCPYHHRGAGWVSGGGPSLAHGSKPFNAAFGSQRELLAKANKLIDTIGKRL